MSENMPEEAQPTCGFDEFWEALEASDFKRATQVAQSLPYARPLAVALQLLVSCEILYLKMDHFASRHSPLERRLDTTARDLEACLSHPALQSGGSPALRGNWSAWRLASFRDGPSDVRVGSAGSHGLSHEAPTCFEVSGMYVEAVATAILTCRAPAWPAFSLDRSLRGGLVTQLVSSPDLRVPSPGKGPALASGSGAQGQSAEPLPLLPAASIDGLPSFAAVSALTAAQRGALSDSVELLRLRRAMLHIYAELLTGSGSLGTQPGRAAGLADRVRELRSSRAAALGAPLLAGLRELTLIELGALEPLLRAHALLPDAQLRDTLLLLAVARQELNKLGSPSSARARAAARAPAVATLPVGFMGSLPFMRPVGGTPHHHQASPEPNLHRFLRSFASRLADKAALFLHSMLIAQPQLMTPAGAAGAMAIARSSTPPLTTPSGLGLGLGLGRTFNVSAMTPATAVEGMDERVGPTGDTGGMMVGGVEVGAGSSVLGGGGVSGGTANGRGPAGVSVAASAFGGSGLSPSIAGGLTVDYASLMQGFVAKEKGAVLAAVLLRPDGLSLRTNRNGATYACRSEEASLAARHVPSRHAISSGGGENGSARGDPWPTLFSTLGQGSTALRALWPTLISAIDRRRTPLKVTGTSVAHGAVAIGPKPIPELGGVEHCLWLLPIDERVLIVIAMAGRRASDAAVTSLLSVLASGLNHDKLIEGSQVDQQRLLPSSWWDDWLRKLTGRWRQEECEECQIISSLRT